MQIINNTSELAPLDAVRPHPKNPRQGDIGSIHESIQANGFYGAIIAQKSTGFILAGNHRWQAARQSGATEIPITWVDVDDDHALRILLADNRTNDLASYDDNALAELLKEIHEAHGNLIGTGYDGDALDELLADLGQSAEPPAVPEAQVDKADELREKWGTELGQLWQIGPHRLLIGDSTKPETYERLMNGNKANMVFTDPPWNVAIGGDNNPRHRQREGLQNDDLPPEAFQAFLKGFATALTPHLEGDLYCVLGASEWPTLDSTLRSVGYHWSATIIWAKDQFVLGRSKYHRRYEPIWYGWQKKGKSSYIGTRKEDDVWEIPRPTVSDEHPTMKPVELPERAITNSASRGGIVLEPFAGAGSTMLAAERVGRVAYGIELAPKYVAVILQRFSDAGLTPELAE